MSLNVGETEFEITIREEDVKGDIVVMRDLKGNFHSNAKISIQKLETWEDAKGWQRAKKVEIPYINLFSKSK